MSDTPTPPPQSAPEQAQQERTAAETAALILFVGALAQSGSSSTDEQDMRVIRGIAAKIVKAIGSLTLASAGALRPTGADLDRLVDSIVTDQFLRDALNGVRSLRRHVVDARGDDGGLDPARNAAGNFATTLYNSLAVEVATKLAPDWFKDHVIKKTWISRYDPKVRSLHRRLHGKTVRFDKEFWRWPITGQTLRYPGDPEAPLEATMNCRCVLLLTWSKPDEISSVIPKLPPMT